MDPGIIRENNTISVYSQNVNSLIGLDRRLALQQELTTLQPLIVFLTETRLSDRFRPRFEGYNIIRNDAGRGTAILIRDNIDFKSISFANDTISATLISVPFRTSDNETKQLLLGSVYIPSDVGRELSPALDSLYQATEAFDLCIMGGDFNSRHQHWGDSRQNQNGRQLFRWWSGNPGNSLEIIHPEGPTFSRSASTIDFFLISADWIDRSADSNFKCQTLPSFSDHFTLFLEIKLNNFHLSFSDPATIRSFKKTEWGRFREDLKSEIEGISLLDKNVLSREEIDAAINSLTEALQTCISRHSRNAAIPKNQFRNVSDKILKWLKVKSAWLRQLKRIFHRHGNRINAEYQSLSSRIRCLSTCIKEALRIEMNEQFQKRLGAIKPSPHAFKEIDRISGRKRTKVDPKTDPIICNGRTLLDVDEKLLAFSEYFSSVYEEKPSQINAPNFTKVTNKVREIKERLSLFSGDRDSHLCTRMSIENIIKFMNNKKSAGPDQISNYIIRKCPRELSHPLRVIFSSCIRIGYFPDAWKIAKIIIIPKKNNSKNIDDFRPISMLSNLGKILEKLIIPHLESFCEVAKVIPDSQFGFMRCHSTEHAILHLQDEIVHHLRQEQCTVACSLDLRKAFDTV